MKAYRRLFGLSRFSSFFSLVALAYFNNEISYLTIPAVTSFFTSNPLWIAAATVVRFAPGLIFYGLAGHWADRFSARKVLVLSNAVRSLLYASIGILGLAGLLNIYVVCLIYLLISIGGVCHYAGAQTAVGEVIPRSQNLEVQILLELAFRFSCMAGPLAAGYAISYFGINKSFFLQAAIVLTISLLSVWLPARVRKPEEAPVFGEGAKFIFNLKGRENKILLSSAVLAAFIGGCIMTVFAIAPFYMMTALKLSAKVVGWIFFFEAAAAFFLTLFIKQLTRGFGSGQVFFVAVFLCVCSIFLFSAAKAFPLLILSFSLGAAGFSALRITYSNLCHLLSPLRIRGGVIGVHEALINGSVPVAVMIFSFMAKAWGYQMSYFIVGLISLVGFIIYFFSPLRGLRIESGKNGETFIHGISLDDAMAIPGE